MTSLAYWGGPATARRLAIALAVSACAHAAVLANVTLARGPAQIALFVPGRPLAARLAPARASADAPEPLLPRPEPGADAAAQRAKQPANAAGLPSAEIYYRASELDERALALNQVDVAYPESALASGVSGVVRLRLLIDREGRLRDAGVVDSRPAGVFENAALEAVRLLRFRPAIRDGAPVGSVKIIEVPFDPDCNRTGSCLP